jgi:hypothetical protein
VENKEEKTVRQAPSLKSTSATKQVWKVKIKLVSNSTQEEDLNHWTPCREVKLVVINNFLFSTA